MVKPGFCFSPKESHHVAHGELAGSSLSFDCGVGQFAFTFLKVEDTLFDRILYSDLVDLDVDCLVETMDTVNRLFFHELEIHELMDR